MGDFAAAALAPAPQVSGGFASWNARWLVDPHTERSARKRARIAHEVLAGRPCAIQETHWRPADREAWVHAVPGATVVASYAPAGRQGGVATWPPIGWSVQGELDALAGHVLACHARAADGTDWWAASVYADPAEPRPALELSLIHI